MTNTISPSLGGEIKSLKDQFIVQPSPGEELPKSGAAY